jgi:predicted negative regulator of RcsB-dependent stress response
VTQEREPAERIRNLLLRGDNLLKHGGDRDKALAAFEEARQAAADESVDPRVRQLVEHRIASLDELLGE